MSSDPLSYGSSFPAVVGGARSAYSPRLRELANLHASGVYVLYDAKTRESLYVGESHSGRLYDTITRHFRAWSPANDPQGRRVGGTTYARERVRIAVQLTGDGEAADHQYAAILAFSPRDNQVRGDEWLDDAPF